MSRPDFSFIVLTYNEEVHLPRLLESIQGLGAPVFVLDSGSTDETVSIARSFGAQVLEHPFENHPKQWDYALNNFPVETPWTIGLDADHIVSPELFQRLSRFRDADMDPEINGIYFNRKNFFKGRWIRFGGYFPKYLLKMFRTGVGHSDLNENMDHRFIVPGKTLVWKDGYLLEENLKENRISFWIDKHNRYSTLVAEEEIERLNGRRRQARQAKAFGNPDEKTAYLKKLWWRMPLFVRPFLYFFYRYFFKLGFLDGKEGFIFHFLQAFWFRLLVDIKIDEHKKSK
ncbi:MAG: glycosyltransferase family 2 protein [Bacteroidetes bacterium]|nr:MAG: glycosyltransferase family 2 protein [Bacteroidota bacterium]